MSDDKNDEGAAAASRPTPSPRELAADVAAVRNELESYRQRARLAEDRLAELLEGYRQLRNDTEAHRDRLTKTLSREYNDQREIFLIRFIEVMDNVERALEAAQTSRADENLVQGLIMVRGQLLQILQSEGLERVPVIGAPFDPAVAEAVQMRDVDDPDQHHVVLKEIVRGYKLNGHVARPARVVVGEYKGEAKE